MTQRDLFGGRTRMQEGLKEPIELDCKVMALSDHAAKLNFIGADDEEQEVWVPLSLLEFRGAGRPQKGTQVLEIERWKAKEIGAL